MYTVDIRHLDFDPVIPTRKLSAAGSDDNKTPPPQGECRIRAYRWIVGGEGALISVTCRKKEKRRKDQEEQQQKEYRAIWV